jgi:hypothetical protein
LKAVVVGSGLDRIFTAVATTNAKPKPKPKPERKADRIPETVPPPRSRGPERRARDTPTEPPPPIQASALQSLPLFPGPGPLLTMVLSTPTVQATPVVPLVTTFAFTAPNGTTIIFTQHPIPDGSDSLFAAAGFGLTLEGSDVTAAMRSSCCDVLEKQPPLVPDQQIELWQNDRQTVYATGRDDYIAKMRKRETWATNRELMALSFLRPYVVFVRRNEGEPFEAQVWVQGHPFPGVQIVWGHVEGEGYTCKVTKPDGHVVLPTIFWSRPRPHTKYILYFGRARYTALTNPRRPTASDSAGSDPAAS